MRKLLPIILILGVLASCSTEQKTESTNDTGNTVEAVENTTVIPSGEVTTTTTGRVNPPHGEPGHRCEIPVGAPLDDFPEASGEGTTLSPPPADAGNTGGPKIPAVSGDVKVNPPHGEPGHDCAIPVGAPLNN